MKYSLDGTFPLLPDKQHIQQVCLLSVAQADLETTMQGVRNSVETWVRCFADLKLLSVAFAGGVTYRNGSNGHRH